METCWNRSHGNSCAGWRKPDSNRVSSAVWPLIFFLLVCFIHCYSLLRSAASFNCFFQLLEPFNAVQQPMRRSEISRPHIRLIRIFSFSPPVFACQFVFFYTPQREQFIARLWAHLFKESKIMPRAFLLKKAKVQVNYQKKWTNIDTTAPLVNDELLCNYVGLLPQLSK